MNWFDAGGAAYAEFRPTYPPELIALLADAAPGRTLAADVGCGKGQLTVALAGEFDAVLGLDPSASQLAHAIPHERVTYRMAPAERLPVADRSVDLVTAAQAAHWFDLPRFYAEVRRVLVPSGALALVSYGRQQLDSAVDERFQRFYSEEVGAYWPAERQHVDAGYRTLEFPFDELPVPPLEIRRDFTLPDLLGYVSTWSATRRAREAVREDLLDRFGEEMAELWGDPDRVRRARWPVNVRLARVA
ncbi:class I SAM-dependent methyltransferase [Ammonicoccus fulvus]|uniref:Class I SAM-dependent methyltransferase n=1 Tax=Ammonicoccus fulvus TaxID=3138240 RepID=A0ABZ3FKU4_9ACTN